MAAKNPHNYFSPLIALPFQILSSICKRSSNLSITITKPVIEAEIPKIPASTSQTNNNSTIFRIKKPKLDSAMVVDFVQESDVESMGR